MSCPVILVWHSSHLVGGEAWSGQKLELRVDVFIDSSLSIGENGKAFRVAFALPSASKRPTLLSKAWAWTKPCPNVALCPTMSHECMMDLLAQRRPCSKNHVFIEFAAFCGYFHRLHCVFNVLYINKKLLDLSRFHVQPALRELSVQTFCRPLLLRLQGQFGYSPLFLSTAGKETLEPADICPHCSITFSPRHSLGVHQGRSPQFHPMQTSLMIFKVPSLLSTSVIRNDGMVVSEE